MLRDMLVSYERIEPDCCVGVIVIVAHFREPQVVSLFSRKEHVGCHLLQN